MCVARRVTVRLDPLDADALERARKDGWSASELLRRGLRVVAARYYRGRRPPATRLFIASDATLGDESALYKKLKDERDFGNLRVFARFTKVLSVIP